MRFETNEEGNSLFDAESSLLSTDEILNLAKRIASLGLKSLGGWTDKGVSKLVNVESQLEEWTKRLRGKVDFINVYGIFFFKSTSPSGLLAILPSGFYFFSGIVEPSERTLVDFTDQPASRKSKLTEVSKMYDLKWWGDIRNPVLFRHNALKSEKIEAFLEDLGQFFSEVGFAEL